MEGVGGVAPVGRGVGERPRDLVHLEERPRPPVADDERERVGALALDVDEVDAEPVDLGAELRQRVQTPLLLPPVVAVAPVGGQLPHVREIRPHRPARAVDLVRPPRRVEARPQVVENGVVDVNLERLGRGGHVGAPLAAV